MNENQLTIVEVCEFEKPDLHEIDYLPDDINKVCKNRFFPTFEYRHVYDIQNTNISKDEEVNFTITHRSMDFKTEVYDLKKKARINGFIFNQTNKPTTKNYSNLSNTNIHFYLEHRIPKTNRHFFRILSQSRDYVQTHCNDLNISFHFACRIK